jgi:hypothetical protein
MTTLVRPLVLFVSILLSGFVLLLFVQREVRDVFWDQSIVMLFACGKTVFGVIEMFRRIARTSDHDLDQRHLFAMIGLYTALFVASFALDNLALLEVDPRALSGIGLEAPLCHRAIDMVYYSLSTFTTAGFGDILPVSTSARVLAMGELMLAFFLTVLVIANFSTLREQFRKRNAGKAAD